MSDDEILPYNHKKEGTVRFKDIEFSRNISEVERNCSITRSDSNHSKDSLTSRKTLSQRIANKLLDDKKGCLPRLSAYLSDFSSKKKTIVVILIGCLLSLIFMIINWNGNDLINNALSIFSNIVGLIFLVTQAFKSKDETQELKETIDETKKIIEQNLKDKEKEEERMNNLIETINNMKNFGGEEFRRMIDDLRCDRVDKKKINEIMNRQKTLIDRLSEVTIQNEMEISDNELIEYGKKIKEIICMNELNENKNLNKHQKKLIIENNLYSSKILKAYVEKRNVLKNFEFQRNRISGMMEEEDIQLETKSFKSIRLVGNKSFV